MNRYGSDLQHLSQSTVLVVALVVVLSIVSSAQTLPLGPPTGPIYLGAYVNPTGQGESVDGVLDLEKQMNRTLAMNAHSYSWTGLGSNFPSPLEENDLTQVRIPVISWNCSVSNAVVASGAADAAIIAAAQAIRTYGSPVFLRYMESMNLPDTANNRTACHGPSDSPDGYFSPQDFIAAWKHIRQVFACPNVFSPCQPVTNVMWLWNPSAAGASFATYYPGDDQVDWIGVDAFDSDPPGAQNPFFDSVNLAYSALTSLAGSKPILLETAAPHGSQAAYLNTDAPVRTLQNDFPGIRAFIYYDAPDSDSDWVLDNGGGCAFIILGLSQYMSAYAMPVEQMGTPPPPCCTCMLP